MEKTKSRISIAAFVNGWVKMKPMNERKIQQFWADIYPNMERKILLFSAGAPPNKTSYPRKRVWLSVEIPSDLELWPEIFEGKEVKVMKVVIE